MPESNGGRPLTPRRIELGDRITVLDGMVSDAELDELWNLFQTGSEEQLEARLAMLEGVGKGPD